MDYIFLPLYSYDKKTDEKKCFEQSAMNQSKAKGRTRSEYEVYIPIPSCVREITSSFLGNNFTLKTEEGKVIKASICQAGDKALMSNPNSDLGEWLFRKLKFDSNGIKITTDDN